MSTSAELRKTVLHPRHTGLGATLAPFGGWEMPLWYRAGAIKEHLAVVRAAGLFDTSHMDVVMVEGDGRAFLDYAFTRSLAGARANRAVYGAFLTPDGLCLDDAVIYPFADGRHAIVSNAAMGRKIADHLARLPGADKLAIVHADDRPAKIDLQGPASVKLIRQLFSPKTAEELFQSFPYFSFRGDFDFSKSDVRLADATPVLLSRSGYTGELGFELFAPRSAMAAIWDRLLELGAADGILPCGLAARDSLRTGAVLPLSHQDIGPWPFINHPWQIALPLSPDGTFAKDFVGRSALDPAANPHTLPFVGFDARRVDAHSARVFHDGKDVGGLTTIVTDMAIGRVDGRVISLASPGRPEGWQPKGLACGFARVEKPLPSGSEIVLRDARREIRVVIADDIRPDRTARKKINA